MSTYLANQTMNPCSEIPLGGPFEAINKEPVKVKDLLKLRQPIEGNVSEVSVPFATLIYVRSDYFLAFIDNDDETAFTNPDTEIWVFAEIGNTYYRKDGSALSVRRRIITDGENWFPIQPYYIFNRLDVNYDVDYKVTTGELEKIMDTLFKNYA